MSFESFKKSILEKSDSYSYYKAFYDKQKIEKSSCDKISNRMSQEVHNGFSSLDHSVTIVKTNTDAINNELTKLSSLSKNNINSLNDDMDVVKNKIDLIIDSLSNIAISSAKLNSLLKDISNDLDLDFDSLNKEFSSITNKIDIISDELIKSLINSNNMDKMFLDSFKSVNDNFNLIFESLDKITSFVYNHEKRLNTLIQSTYINQSYLNEMNYSNIFNNSITNSEWLVDKNFSLNNAASNYSFMYTLYRILNELKPTDILEFGLGQTTKMTSQYASYFKYSKLSVIEDNQDWINNFSKTLRIPNNVKINHVNREQVIIENSECWKYANLEEVLGIDSFNLIIVDGPIGFNQDFPRSNIWDLIDYLDDDFAIILDDYERQGEQNTASKLFKLLEENNIKYDTIVFKGLKHQLAIYSDNYSLIGWF